MKKSTRVALILVLMMALCLLAGCGNMQVLDTTFTFDKAIIELANGEIVSGEVQSWKDYEGDQLQVKIGGKTYLVHSSNVVLISE